MTKHQAPTEQTDPIPTGITTEAAIVADAPAVAGAIEQVPVTGIKLDPAYTLRQPDPAWAKRLARNIVDPAECPIELGVPTDDPAWPDGQYMVIDGTRRFTAYTAVSLSDIGDDMIVGKNRPVAKAGEPPVVAPRFTASDTLPCIVTRAPWADLLFAAAVANDREAPKQALDDKSQRRAAEWIFRSRPSFTQREVARRLHCSQSAVRNYHAAYRVRELAPTETAGLTNELCQAVHAALVSTSSPACAPNLVAPLLAHFKKSGAPSQSLAAKLKDMSRSDLDEAVRADYQVRIQNAGLFTVPDTRGKGTTPPVVTPAEPPQAEVAGPTEPTDMTETKMTQPEQAATREQDLLRGELFSFFRYAERMMGKADATFIARAILESDTATMEIAPLVERLRSYCQHIEAAMQVETRQRAENARQPEPEPEPEPEPTDEELRAIAGAGLDAAMALAAA